MQPAPTMQAQLDPLITLISVRRRTRMLRREVARRHRGYSCAETEKDCIDQLIEWLAVTCHLLDSYEAEAAVVRELAETTWFALSVVYLEALVTTWTQAPPDRNQLQCLQTVVDLLESVASKRDQMHAEIGGELVAAFFLCAALRNQVGGFALVGEEQEGVFARSELFALLRGETQLAEVIRIIRRQPDLADF